MDIKKRGEIMTDDEAYLAMDDYLKLKLNGNINDMYKSALQSAIEMAHHEDDATKKIAELEKQLAEMKCCGNCANYDPGSPSMTGFCELNNFKQTSGSNKCDKWEMK